MGITSEMTTAKNKLERNQRTSALVAAAAVAASMSALIVVSDMITTTCKAITIICDKDKQLLRSSKVIIRANGRYICGRGLPPPEHSVWKRVDKRGDELEFFHFTSLTRESFDSLVTLCHEYVIQHTIQANSKGPPRKGDLARRKVKPRDAIAMTIKYLLSKAEPKDLHVQFGISATTYHDHIIIGMQAIIRTLSENEKSRVFWDRSVEGMNRAAQRTAQFLDIPNVVAMVDGNKLESFNPQDPILQNRDWNGWTRDANRNLVLVWDPFGKIVDAAVNAPGNFHDSRSASWCRIYDHIAAIPDNYKVVCDDAFKTKGILQGKLIKTKEQFNEGHSRSSYDQTLTHLRQCSEWGNNVLTGVFRRLRTNLPTDNVRRAYIMWSCILLHNWRTETVGRNQIQTYFDEIVKSLDAIDENEERDTNGSHTIE